MSTLFSSGEGLTAAKLDALDDRLIAAENAVYPTAWNTVTVFTNGWTGSVAGSPDVGYRLDGYTVWWRGLLVAPSAGTLSANSDAFTLPPGYRPSSGNAARVRWARFTDGVLFRFNVADTGLVSFVLDSAGTTAASTRFHLDGMSFPI